MKKPCADPRRLLRFLLTIIISIAAADSSYSAPRLPEAELSWKNITVDGKKTAVFCLFMDSRGIMWLGSNSGLYFYDGVTAHPVGRDELSGIQIYAIVEKDDCLYIGSNNGLLIYDYSTGTVSPSHIATPKEIRTLLLTDDVLWIGGLNGIVRMNLRDNQITDFSEGLPHRSVYSMLRDSRGILYVGTYSGLARWSAQEESFKPLKIRAGESEDYPLFANCMLEADDRETIYVGGEGSLLKYTPSNDRWEKVTPLETNNIKSLSNGEPDHILIGTDDGVFDLDKNGIRQYRHDSRQELSLADNEIWCIYSDKQHNVWTGHERGLSIASNSSSIRTIKLSALTHSGEGNEIHSIYRDSQNNLWLAGTNGVIKLSKDNAPYWYRHSDRPNSLSHNRIRAIHEDSEGNMWFATDGGINRLNPADNKFDVFHVVDEYGKHNTNWVYALIEDGDYFWAGSFLNGLHLVHKSKLKGKGCTVVSDLSLNSDKNVSGQTTLANDFVNNVVKDDNGNIWILLFRDNALTRYTPSTGASERYDIHELTGEYPTHICSDRNGRIWCAFEGGAAVFESDGSCNTITFPHTNGDESVLAIGEVGNGIWISTQSNVWEIDGNTLKATLLPIPQNSYTAIYEDTTAGKVLLGGTDEILEADYSNIGSATDYNTIKMVLHEQAGGCLNLSDLQGGASGLTIPYGGNASLVVSTLDYSPWALQRYMYKISESPADSTGEWIVMPEGANTITFSDMKMGHSHLLLKKVGSPMQPLSIPLTVKAPNALSWWAICVYALIAAGVIYWVFWYTKRRNLESFREQERQTALENVERKLSFLSDISHDLKTPLSMIIGPVSLMKERAKDQESKKILETIYDNAVRLNNMIHRTLELQHLEDADESLLILSTFDVVEFCHSVFEVFNENNPQKNFIFHASCPEILIEADAVKLESVITNLLSNACKYSDDSATISCGISKQDDNVEIVVSDDGVGIADIDQTLVFQRMFRAPSTSKLREGTGLGLYLIKKYLELMKGNINLYSKEGQGTTFVVTLPISEKVRPQSPRNPESHSPDIPKILIVEDNIQIYGFIMEILSDEYTCFTAENGRSGLAIAASIIPDLIIVDEMMPIMSGLEMVRRMKLHPRLSSVPIIMLTAKTDNKTENESIKLGIEVFMTKPFEPAALTGRISQLLKARKEIKEKVRIQAITEAETKPIEAESVNEKNLAKIAKIIEDNISDPDLNVNMLCEKSGIPNKQLYRLVKKYMGTAPLDYIRRVRLQKAALLLSQNRFTVSEISYMVGFKTPSYFAKCFQSQYGVKPSQYKSEDESVSYK